MRVAIIGRTEWLYKTIEKLNKAGHRVVMIATCKASPEYTRKEDDFYQLALNLNIPFFCTAKLENHIEEIKKCGAEVGVSMNWPRIFDNSIISLFKHGILNAHPGDLPRYRGNACPNWAILNGEKQIALTIHQMDPDALDSGAVWKKEYIPLTAATTIGEIEEQLSDIIPNAFVQVVSGIQSESLKAIPQSTKVDDILRVYPRKPVDSLIDWSQDAEKICRLVRASSKPFSGAYTYFGKRKMIVWKAYEKPYVSSISAIPGQVAWRDVGNGEVGVTTGSGFLVLQSIRYQDRDEKPANILTSLRMRLGMNIEEEIEELWEMLSKLQTKLSTYE